MLAPVFSLPQLPRRTCLDSPGRHNTHDDLDRRSPHDCPFTRSSRWEARSSLRWGKQNLSSKLNSCQFETSVKLLSDIFIFQMTTVTMSRTVVSNLWNILYFKMHRHQFKDCGILLQLEHPHKHIYINNMSVCVLVSDLPANGRIFF